VNDELKGAWKEVIMELILKHYPLHLLGGPEINHENVCQGSVFPADVPNEQLPNVEHKIYLLIQLDL
jgi:hypothetical protein